MKKYIVSILCYLSIPCYAVDITAVTDHQHPISAAPDNAHVIYLDATDLLEDKLFSKLPSTQQEAEAFSRQAIRSIGTATKQQFIKAHQEVLTAWSMGITKIPAVVVDNHVVYGESNVLKAITLIEQFKKKKK